jgi:hypothetical protein
MNRGMKKGGDSDSDESKSSSDDDDSDEDDCYRPLASSAARTLT